MTQDFLSFIEPGKMQYYDELISKKNTLTVNRILATAIGLEPALFASQILFYRDVNSLADKRDHYIYNQWWCYNTASKWQEDNFPFWSIASIRRYLGDLERLHLVYSTGAFNKADYDQTKWSTFLQFNYYAFMMLWERMGKPRYNSKSEPYNKFLETWESLYEQSRLAIHVDQTTTQLGKGGTTQVDQSPIQVDLGYYSSCVGVLLKLIIPIPEITTEITEISTETSLSTAHVVHGALGASTQQTTFIQADDEDSDLDESKKIDLNAAPPDLKESAWVSFCKRFAVLTGKDYSLNRAGIETTAAEFWKKGNGLSTDDLDAIDRWYQVLHSNRVQKGQFISITMLRNNAVQAIAWDVAQRTEAAKTADQMARMQKVPALDTKTKLNTAWANWHPDESESA